MQTYPISVPMSSYGGSNSAKLAEARSWNEDAAKLENHLNSVLRSLEGTDWKYHQFRYGQIAAELDMEKQRVYKILFGVDCGSNGITVANHLQG